MNTLIENGSTYRGTEIKIKNTKYHITIVSGKSNYLVIKKLTANPFGTTGKYFNNFDEAVRNYKSAAMKVELLKLETLTLKN